MRPPQTCTAYGGMEPINYDGYYCRACEIPTDVLNLVSNAVRYTAAGGIVVGCRYRENHVRIEVWDSGLLQEIAGNLDELRTEERRAFNPRSITSVLISASARDRPEAPASGVLRS
jgi:hypothetical protein